MKMTRSNFPMFRPIRVGLVLACLTCLSIPLWAQNADRKRIEETLDRLENISIVSRPMSEALQALSEKTKLRFEIDAAAAELLPYGPKSVVTITVQNMTLRRGLTVVFEGLGMRMETVEDRIKIVPAPFLERMSRRLTKDELGVVYAMARTTAFSAASPPATLVLQIDGEPGAAQLLDQKLQDLRAENSLRHLEAATNALSWAWRLDGRRIVIERNRARYLDRLSEALTTNFVQRPVDVVLADILERARIPFTVENQAFQATGANTRKVDLITRRPAMKLLELICQSAGLDFEVTDAGVVFRQAVAKGPPAPPGPDVQPIKPAEEMVDLLIEIRTGVWASVRMAKSRIPLELREALERRMREVFGDNPPAFGRGQP